MTIRYGHKVTAIIAVIGANVFLCSCAVDAQQAAEPQPIATQSSAAPKLAAFGSLDEARRAVAGVIGCDDEPKTDPIINPDLAGFTAGYVVWANRVQVVWLKTKEARSAGHQLHSDSAQPLTIVEGENWMVVGMSEALNETLSGKALRALARELGGDFRYVCGAESSWIRGNHPLIFSPVRPVRVDYQDAAIAAIIETDMLAIDVRGTTCGNRD